MTPADIIRLLMIELDLGTAAGDWPIYISFIPSIPDEAICVYDTAGKTDGRLMDGEQIEHPGIQIRVRGNIYPDTWSKSNAIARALDGQRRVEITGESDDEYLIENISRAGPPIPLGVEEEGSKRRHHFTINAAITLSMRVDGVWVPFVLAVTN